MHVAAISYKGIISALLAIDTTNFGLAEREAECEWGSQQDSPQRDKMGENKSTFNMGAKLSDGDHHKVLELLERNNDRFSASLEDIEPFT